MGTLNEFYHRARGEGPYRAHPRSRCSIEKTKYAAHASSLRLRSDGSRAVPLAPPRDRPGQDGQPAHERGCSATTFSRGPG
ncbi:hypothetical protein C8Q78DRAFT_1011460 [Trametes maxima]|nr:hypothetical protein C8Q78DRAFT_1011460 [Trametes maxima]